MIPRGLVAIALLIAVFSVSNAGGDTDGDGVPDGADNCPLDANCDPVLAQAFVPKV